MHENQQERALGAYMTASARQSMLSAQSVGTCSHQACSALHCRGGLVSEGLEVARLFLAPNSPIVLTESKAMAAEPPRSGPAPPLTSAPLTVMVNEHTASASEILAGALHDNCRAVLVGGRTYGKGLIQSVYELSDSSGLVITVGKYLTPRRTDIDRSGIMPDFRSQPTAERAAAALDACRLEAAAAAEAGKPAGVAWQN